MSQMPPFLRAYRQGLRDVQRAVLLHAQTMPRAASGSSAILVAADWISVPLRELRDRGIGSLDPKVREDMSATSIKKTEFFSGYLAGFDTAVDVVSAWGQKMIDPTARDAIAEVVTRLQNVRSEMAAEGPEGMTTLRARTFVIKD